ncbi:MAG: aminotransferase class I/II-fold pyridoxal phosphate-dependent enzyme [Planctomycetes bacterium]|nr:aminotransferase class I/II-fold pyridoxal phosphate-dependent enzyme [Planctomycetota bacterium]
MPTERRKPDVHLNLNVRGMKPSATVAINERSDAMRREGREVFKLGLGQSPFPVPQPVIEELRVNAFQKDYLPVKGLLALREAVSDYHRRTQGVQSTAEDVLIGPGSKELMFLLQLVYYGDILIPTPAWVSYAPQAHIIGRHIVWLPTRAEDNFRLTADQLRGHCEADPARPRILILNYPGNPTGVTYAQPELEALAAVASEFRVIVLSDEIYGELNFEGAHTSIARFYPEGTIVSTGLSKWCGAGGWRLGAFTFPRSLNWLLQAMAAVGSETYTSTSAPIQFAAVRAFRGGTEIEHYLASARRVLKALGTWSAAKLRAAGATVPEPQGAFYLFPDFSGLREALRARKIRNSAAMCEQLLKDTGVATLPGSEFGRGPEELSARLAYVDFDGAQALSAADETPREQPLGEEFLRNHMRNVTTAIDRVCAWFTPKPA